MSSSYRESASEFLAAKKLKGEAELLLFYRTLILRLLVVLFLVTLSSLSFLMLLREGVIAFANGVMNLELIITFATVTIITGVGLYFFLREEIFLSELVQKAHKLKKTAPSTYGLSASDSTTT